MFRHRVLNAVDGTSAGIPNYSTTPKVDALLKPSNSCSPQEIAGRLAALQVLEILDTPPERAFDDLVQLAAKFCDASVALITFLDDSRQWFKAKLGLSLSETPLQEAVCAFTISASSDIFVVPDLTQDLRFRDFPCIRDAPHLRFYAGAPIRSENGVALGTICVLDGTPRPDGLAQEQEHALLALARMVGDQLSVRRASVLLRQSEQRYRALTAASSAVVWRAAPDGQVTEGWSWEEFSGQAVGSAVAVSWQERVHPDDLPELLALWAHNLEHRSVHNTEFRIRDFSGEYRWMSARAVPVRDQGGVVIEWIGTLSDIHEQRLAQVALIESEDHYRHSVELNPQIPWTADPNGNITEAGPLWFDLTGMSKGQALGQGWAGALHPDDYASVYASWAIHLASGEPVDVEYRIRMKDGTYKWMRARAAPRRDENGNVVRWYGTLEDIHEQRLARESIAHLAHHDVLTGLPNRAMFLERLESALETAESSGASVGMIYLDLDSFKDINDTLGHDAGDAVLVAAAKAMESTAPRGTLPARIGGDEFAILYGEHCSPENMRALALKLKQAFAAPVLFSGHELSCKASLGLALYPQSDSRPGELMKNADLALYEAKKAGGNQYAFFTPKTRQAVQSRMSALACARDALSRDAVMPFYQPKVSFETGKICGFEALLRWKHPRKGVQQPGLIKEAFDDPVLSLQLGKRMLERVLADMKAWRSAGLSFGSVAINLSADQFSRTDVAANILRALSRAGLRPCDLEVEVTESVFLGTESNAVAYALDALHEAGVQIALDDFGTGFASLTHLNKFPVSWLKIDRSFIGDMAANPDAAAIVAAVISLSKDLGIQVVAEGVETDEQWQVLKDKGCDVAQGYLLSKPVGSAAVPDLVRNWSLRDPSLQDQARYSC